MSASPHVERDPDARFLSSPPSDEFCRVFAGGDSTGWGARSALFGSREVHELRRRPLNEVAATGPSRTKADWLDERVTKV
jgi:hypothetical protein